MKLKDILPTEELTAKIMKIAKMGEVRYGLGPNLEVEMKALNRFVDRIFIQIRKSLLVNKVHSMPGEYVKVPLDWKEAFKERWFPLRLKKRYPVRYRDIEVVINNYRVCPHIAIPDSSMTEVHFDYLFPEK